MKLLILTAQLPYPPNQGTSLRNLHIIKGLADDHSVTLLSFADESAEFGPLLDLCDEILTIPEPERTTGTRLWQLVTTRQPDMAHRLNDLSFNHALHELLVEQGDRPYEIVQVEGIELAHTIPIIRDASPSSKIVFDDHNAETALQASAMQTDWRIPRRWPAAIYSWVQVQRLRRFEQWAIESADAVTVVSDRDQTVLQELTSDKVGTVIPNSIDIELYQHTPTAPEDRDPAESFDVIFVGKMDYRPNVDAVLWFVAEIWPRILEAVPSATFAAVGQKPHPRLERIRYMNGVTVTGFVQSVHPYLQNARVIAVPLRMGSGTRLKLIEAMAASKPIVGTSIGVEGFAVEDGVHLRIADSAKQFADAVIDLLATDSAESADLRARLTANALQFAQGYDYRKITRQFATVYQSLIKK